MATKQETAGGNSHAGHTRRVKAEGCRRLDSTVWRRAGALEAGAAGIWRWEDGCCIDYGVSADALTLHFRLGCLPVVQRVGIARRPSAGCAAGGVWYWFRCPFCAARARRLYLRAPPHRTAGFGCAKCQEIAYTSQSEDRLARSWRRLHKVRAPLNPDGTRPPGMRVDVYSRLRAEYESRRLEARAAWIERLRAMLAITD